MYIDRKLKINIKIDGPVEVDDEHSVKELNNYLKVVTNPLLVKRLSDILNIDEEIISIDSSYE